MKALVLAAMLMTGACAQAQSNGNGSIKKEDRKVGDFTGIKAGGAFTIVLTQGTTNAVKVEAEEKMISKIKTEVTGDVLTIYTEGKTETNKPMKIYVMVKELKKIEINGASHLEGVSGFSVDKLSLGVTGAASIELDVKAAEVTISASGAGNVELKGSAGKLSADLSGASSLRAFDLDTKSVSVEASGASHVKITASETISAEASGASSINYKGEPENKTLNTSGASSIQKTGA